MQTSPGSNKRLRDIQPTGTLMWQLPRLRKLLHGRRLARQPSNGTP